MFAVGWRSFGEVLLPPPTNVANYRVQLRWYRDKGQVRSSAFV